MNQADTSNTDSESQPETTTLVCLFHQAARAHAAIADLEASGIGAARLTTVASVSGEHDDALNTRVQLLGLPQRDVQHMLEGLRQGGTLLAVDAEGAEADVIETIFARHGANQIDDSEEEAEDNAALLYSTPDSNDAAAVAGIPGGFGAFTLPRQQELADEDYVIQDHLSQHHAAQTHPANREPLRHIPLLPDNPTLDPRRAIEDENTSESSIPTVQEDPIDPRQN